MSDQDTICAVSTAPGHGSIGIIRISGNDSIVIAKKLFHPSRPKDLLTVPSHTIHYGRIIDPEDRTIVDEALVTIMRGPGTYTREDVVEVNGHGGPVALERTLGLVIAEGARQAEPGEFTKRAFLNGRIDLAQAEAVMDVIKARTDASNRAAQEQLKGGLSREVEDLRQKLIGLLAGVEAGVDFPEEDIETPEGRPLGKEIESVALTIKGLISGFAFGKIMREGLATAIVGRPNVGKSSLLNSLLREDRAIVTSMPGTTRDIIEESITINGIAVRIIDTAGIRDTHDLVEQEGVKRSVAALASADLVLLVLDGSEPLHDGDRQILEEVSRKNTVVVINKADVPRKLEKLARPEVQIDVSCKSGQGLDELRKAISRMALGEQGAPGEHAWAVNTRHKQALEKALNSAEKAAISERNNASPEFIALDLRDALDHIGTIIGATYTEDILERVFRDFCIGK
ncbi:MAG: tRNA uridine-5-carboxymethylaminomethyl(34) synthesis GTPase MnmE [Nitrospirota bacterium]|nr:tRNA uridine-5-carboxymethylaminomethyl(34) synthesis GTPase MnmE [Nitrospirota bacterium]